MRYGEGDLVVERMDVKVLQELRPTVLGEHWKVFVVKECGIVRKQVLGENEDVEVLELVTDCSEF